jgi:hypothetical protein
MIRTTRVGFALPIDRKRVVRLGWKTAICRQLNVNIMMSCTRADLTQSDIEALVERSFAMRETHYRAANRRLQWHNDTAGLPFESTQAKEVLPPVQLSNVFATKMTLICSKMTTAMKCSWSKDSDNEIQRMKIYLLYKRMLRLTLHRLLCRGHRLLAIHFECT